MHANLPRYFKYIFLLILLGVNSFFNSEYCYKRMSVGGITFCSTLNGHSLLENQNHPYCRTVWYRGCHRFELMCTEPECLMSSVCMSFNFETRTRICDLNSNSSDQVAVTTRPGFLFSDIDHWPKSLAGACSAKSCGQKACQLDRLGRTACVREFPGCDEPPTLSNGKREYDGVYLGAVATYTCFPDFLMCRNSSSVCKPSRKWSGRVGPCERNRWDTPGGTRLTLPCKPVSRFKLTLYITPTAATRMVVSVRGNQGDRLCHYEFRMNTSAVVINTRNSTRQWGPEIRLTHVPLALGVQSVTEITLEEGIYRLSVNGNGIYNFTERYPDVSPRNVDVEGDVRIESAEITL